MRQRPQDLAHFFCADRVQPACRLVQYEHVWPGDQLQPYTDTTHFAPTDSPPLAVANTRVPDVREAKLREECVDTHALLQVEHRLG